MIRRSTPPAAETAWFQFLATYALSVSCWLLSTSVLYAEDPPDLAWSRTISTGTSDSAALIALAVDSSGNAAIIGETEGTLFSSPIGFQDGYMAVYNPQGERQWAKQFGTSRQYTNLNDVAAGPTGEWLLAGSANFKLGSTHYGNIDMFARRYSSTGTLNWTAQLGTTSDEYGRVIAVSGSSVYVAGETYGAMEGTNAGGSDAFVARFSNNINAAGHLWTAQNGTDDWDSVYDMAYDRGRIFLAGETFGNFNGPNINSTDAFLLSYDSEGNFQWARQYGTANRPQVANAVVADGQNAVYIAGWTQTSATAAPDAFLVKYDLNGTLQWQREFKTNVWDVHTALATDAAGNVYVGGYTGQQSLVPTEASALVLKYSPTGTLLWQKKLDFAATDRTSGIAVSADGKRIWVAGNSSDSDTDPVANGFLALLVDADVPGDYNHDGIVSDLDLLTWRQQFGTGLTDADGNGNGIVEAGDYTVWRDAFVTAGGTGSLASVPEPLGICLWAAAGLGGLGLVRLRS